MKKLLLLGVFLMLTAHLFSNPKTIHVFVALCDNEFQGIVPVPKTLGNGKDPKNNLYWGAMYGVKSFFKYKAEEWVQIEVVPSTNKKILERVLFKHKTLDSYLLADAYDGEYIKSCTEDFLLATNGQNVEQLLVKGVKLNFGGGAGLIAYTGHDGLMDFSVSQLYMPVNGKKRDVVILACISYKYFAPELQEASANGLVLTTGLMAPEAYTLKAIVDGWLNEESSAQLVERAAQAYNTYQKCGIKGARNLFKTLP